MSRKVKATQRHRPHRGLGYLSVMVLVVAALVIGAANEPLKDLFGSFTNFDESPVAVPSEPASRFAPDTAVLDKPQQVEAVIVSETELTVLKVTNASSTRIEYILEPASIGVDASHREAILTLSCALRRVGPARRAVVFVGVGQFVDSAGNPALRTRAETKLSALWVNRLICAQDESEHNIDWERVSEYDIRFDVPRGFKVDV